MPELRFRPGFFVHWQIVIPQHACATFWLLWADYLLTFCPTHVQHACATFWFWWAHYVLTYLLLAMPAGMKASHEGPQLLCVLSQRNGTERVGPRPIWEDQRRNPFMSEHLWVNLSSSNVLYQISYLMLIERRINVNLVVYAKKFRQMLAQKTEFVSNKKSQSERKYASSHVCVVVNFYFQSNFSFPLFLHIHYTVMYSNAWKKKKTKI